MIAELKNVAKKFMRKRKPKGYGKGKPTGGNLNRTRRWNANEDSPVYRTKGEMQRGERQIEENP